MMRYLLLALGGMLLASSPASAQFVVGPGFRGGFGHRTFVGPGGFAHRGFVSFRGPGFGFATYSRSFIAAPVVPFAPTFGHVWVGRRFVNPWFVNPWVGNAWVANAWFGDPWWFGNPWIGGPWVGPGFGPGFGNPFFLPAPPFFPLTATNPPPVINNGGGFDPNVIPAAAREGEFLVITPKGVLRPAEGGTISPAVDRVAARPEKAEKAPPMFRFDPFAEHQKIGFTEVAERNPPVEADRRSAQARLAISRGEFGVAIEHLDGALRAKPADAESQFLKAQALFGAGQYADAAAAMQDGLRTDKGWAKSAIQPRVLFGKDRFDGMLADLRRSLVANPDSAALQFLLAHQLWFDGDRDESAKLFQRLAARLKDASVVEPFLAK